MGQPWRGAALVPADNFPMVADALAIAQHAADVAIVEAVLTHSGRTRPDPVSIKMRNGTVYDWMTRAGSVLLAGVDVALAETAELVDELRREFPLPADRARVYLLGGFSTRNFLCSRSIASDVVVDAWDRAPAAQMALALELALESEIKSEHRLVRLEAQETLKVVLENGRLDTV